MKIVTFSVREIQARIGDALRAVRGGGQVVVTSHGTPVAMLVRPRARRRRLSRVERKLEQMAALGRVTIGKGGPLPRRKLPPLDGLTDQLLADRR